MNKPKITVIMSVYNGERYIEDAIDSILNQTFSDFELIIINDHSTDNSRQIIEKFRDERIIIIDNEKNLGLTKSLNIGLKLAKGEFIARHDADDVSVNTRFEKQIKFLKKNSKVALLGTNVYHIDEKGKIINVDSVLKNPSKNDLIKSNRFAHGSVMFRTEIIDEIGGYNNFFKFSQDYEFWLRIIEKYETRNLKEPLYQLRIHLNSIRTKNIEDATLYCILIQKISRENKYKLQQNNIKDYYNDFNTNEKILYHKTIAYFDYKNKKYEKARKEYKKALKLNPFNLKNIFHILKTYIN